MAPLSLPWWLPFGEVPEVPATALAKQGEVHMLGYGVEPLDDATRDKLLSLRATRESRARRILEKLLRSVWSGEPSQTQQRS